MRSLCCEALTADIPVEGWSNSYVCDRCGAPKIFCALHDYRGATPCPDCKARYEKKPEDAP